MLPARLYVSLSGLLVGWTLLMGPPRRLPVLFWDVYRDELGVLAHRNAVSRSSVDGFWFTGVITPRLVYFGLIVGLVVPLRLAALPFLEEVCYAFVAGVWEAELLAVRVLAGSNRVSHGDEVDVRCASVLC